MVKRIGYLLIKKKAQALGLLDVVKVRLKELSVEVIEILDTVPLEEQGPFDIIIHKISDYQRQASQGDKISQNIIHELFNYSMNHKECIFMDPLETVFSLADRGKMSLICEAAQFEMDRIRTFVPKWTIIESVDDLDSVETNLKDHSIKFPILCKALNAAEGVGAHDMQLIFSRGQLNELTVLPCIAQNFVNHDMNMCKIFVVGDSWCIVNRPSIKNFYNSPSQELDFKENHGIPLKSISFDSHEVSKPDSVSFLNEFGERYQQKISYGNDELVKDSVVNEIIKRLRNVIPFSLLGIDLIIDGNNYGIVDINFLPGYDGMNNFFDEFFKILLNILKLDIVRSNGVLN